MCLFIFQFQNVIRLFENDEFNFIFFFMYRLRPFADPWGSTHYSLGNGSVYRFQGRRKIKKKKVIYAPTGLEPVAVPMETIE